MTNDFGIEDVLTEIVSKAEVNPNLLPDMFEDIHQKLTPDFSGESWMTLFDKMVEGDTASKEMFISLFMTKVVANIPPDFWDKETLKDVEEYFSEIGWGYANDV